MGASFVRARTRRVAAVAVMAVLGAVLGPFPQPTATAVVAPVGSGFTVTPSDLAFILTQIKISERHAMTLTPDDPCGTLVARPGDGIPDAEQIPDRLTSYGLRTVDGSCNNLFPGRETFAAADQPFPRLTQPRFRPAERSPAGFGPVHATSYQQKKGSVFDSRPRMVSNLIVDQTSTNPAAVAAAAHPVRTQGDTGVAPCTADPAPENQNQGVPAGCVPSHHTLFIPNVTTDVGLSPPYNSWFTFFGQFFDHGVDQTVKSGGTVFVPLRDDDPLVTLGPDGRAGTGDEVPPEQRFMVLTRAQNQAGPDGILGDDPSTPDTDESADDVQDADNTDSPWADQSQTYASHSSHQVFLREYALDADAHPTSTGRLLGGPAPNQTGMATWASVKQQAHDLLGLELRDRDVLSVPMIAADPYGKFIPGPERGLPQYVTRSGLVEGDLDAPVPVPADVLTFDTPFLVDIAHNADPSAQDLDHNPQTPPQPPVPDADHTASADFAHQPPGTYDDEMLDAHFCAGDGRVNENIALTAVHQIFHSEHDRLVADIKRVLTEDTSAAGRAALPEWRLASTPDGWNGERLFQAARFITEMEYQHLVFEEFARKIQPAIRPFHVYSPDLQPAVQAEFAHAVYRFGHSMLDDEVARTDSGGDNSLPLLDAFLNPPEYFDSGGTTPYTPEQAAGAIIMGSVDQVGNELDEFVNETLRNNLLGLPLDLATLNLTRARDAGIPPLNDVRRQIFADTNDGQLAPYTSWTDFGQHLKHPESLVNFVAAYGTHPTIRDSGPDGILADDPGTTADEAADNVTTLAAKRAAAKAIVDPTAEPVTPPGQVPADAAAFMFGTSSADLGACQVPGAACSDWSSDSAGVTTTGLDDVDLWVGGLAEVTNLFGGLLGSTFNYVFQNQLENLQDGDRFYYLARTPGMNLRTQLESNSFAELIQRNTDDTSGLKADVFGTADCKFQLAHLAGTPAGFAQHGGTVADDPSTPDCDESLLLLRKPDGTIQYRQFNSVDPSGINGQSVYVGTPGTDRVYGGNDNDTFWGGDGRDWIEGNGGDDVPVGGDGDDIITDLGGFDVQKGGPGSDALDGGIGDDLEMGGDGSDLTNGGSGDNETFAGPGNDYVLAGAGADAVFGDGGDDWIQGGSGQDLLIGDHGAPFFDDPGQARPGSDVFVGQVGENDYDAEGGDDIMSQNAAIDRNAGAGGWDWAIHQYNTVGADDDLMINNNLPGLPLPVVVNRDRWQETEAVSGSRFDDVIHGDDTVPSQLGGAGLTGCDALDATGVARVAGLDEIVPPLTVPLASVEVNAAAGRCPLEGLVWGQGNILLGGGGSDTLEGRGGDDVLDGDRELTVRISVRTDPAQPASEIGSTDMLEHTFQAGNPKNLQEAVFDGSIRPSQLVVVREIKTVVDPASSDTAVFSGPSGSYDVSRSAAGVLTVTQTGADVVGQNVSDGTDILRNVERLRFSDRVVDVATVPVGSGPPPTTPPGGLGTPSAPLIGAGTVADREVTVRWSAPADDGGSPVTQYQVQVFRAGNLVDTVVGIPPTFPAGPFRVVTGLTNGAPYTFRVVALNVAGPSLPSAPLGPLTPATVPGPPTMGTASPGLLSATVHWTAPTDDGGSAVTSFEVQAIRAGTTATTLIRDIPADARSQVVSGLTAGAAYTFVVRAVNARGGSPLSEASNPVVPVAPGGGPAIGTPPPAGPPNRADSLAPRVVRLTPGPGATRVGRGRAVVIRFSEAVTGVRGRSVQLHTVSGHRVRATVRLRADGLRAVLDPVSRLRAGTSFRVTLVGGRSFVRDLAGLPLDSRTWRFRTRR